jgi:hypothetical protein
LTEIGLSHNKPWSGIGDRNHFHHSSGSDLDLAQNPSERGRVSSSVCGQNLFVHGPSASFVGAHFLFENRLIDILPKGLNVVVSV